MNFLIPFSSYPPSSPSTGDFIKFTDSAYTAFYNGSSWDFFFESVPCILPPDISTFSTDNTSSCTFDSTHGYLYWHQANNSANVSSIYKTYTGTKTLTIGVKMALNAGLFNSVASAFGVNVRGSGGAYQTFAILDLSASSLLLQSNNYNSSTSFNANIFSLTELGTGAGHKLFFQIHDNGTNLIYKMGIDLNNLLTYQTVARTSFLTPAAFGIWGAVNAGSAEMMIFHFQIA